MFFTKLSDDGKELENRISQFDKYFVKLVLIFETGEEIQPS